MRAWSAPWQTFQSFALASAGIDGQWGTADDITYPPPGGAIVEMDIFADDLDAGAGTGMGARAGQR